MAKSLSLWTWSGAGFGLRVKDELWTSEGVHVGRFVGDEVYAPDGRYLGEIASRVFLLRDESKAGKRISGFTQHSRAGRTSRPGDIRNGPLPPGRADFPPATSFY